MSRPISVWFTSLTSSPPVEVDASTLLALVEGLSELFEEYVRSFIYLEESPAHLDPPGRAWIVECIARV